MAKKPEKLKYPPLSIKGYRKLSDDEIALINSIKTHGGALEQQLKHLHEVGAELRWLLIAQTQLQLGIMSMCRAVAKPEGF